MHERIRKESIQQSVEKNKRKQLVAKSWSSCGNQIYQR